MTTHSTHRFAWLLCLAASGAVCADEPQRPGEQQALPASIPDSIPNGALLQLKPEQYADDEQASRTADELELAFPAESRPEAVRMLLSILRGGQMGPREGWFGPARSRLTWTWLAERHGLDPQTGSLAAADLVGPEAWRVVLDRNGDGSIAASDLDWSDSSSWVQQAAIATRLFRRLDAEGDGQLTRADLEQFLERTGAGRDFIAIDEFRRALLGGSGRFSPGDEPSREVLVRGLLGSEIGSMHEGPRVGEPAPDFSLKSSDGQTTWQLSQLVGQKPVVLVFGNFTCGPFRTLYPEVDALFEKYRADATFLMIYVREAHPTGGWKMESNSQANVAVAQPTNFEERAAVCTQFCQRLKPSMPVAVDDTSDRVGHAYSGMPARLYVIDRAGRVAFQSGRGPFGFRPAELEQALVLALLENLPPPKLE